VAKRVDKTYKVAYWTDVAITILEFVTGIVGAVKAAAKEAVKQGIKFSLLRAIKAAIKQAAIQGAVFVATAYGLPPVLQASGLNPDFVFAGVVVMQGLTAFQALRSVKEVPASRRANSAANTSKSVRESEGNLRRGDPVGSDYSDLPTIDSHFSLDPTKIVGSCIFNRFSNHYSANGIPRTLARLSFSGGKPQTIESNGRGSRFCQIYRIAHSRYSKPTR
jgi:hypothetical protein